MEKDDSSSAEAGQDTGCPDFVVNNEDVEEDGESTCDYSMEGFSYNNLDESGNVETENTCDAEGFSDSKLDGSGNVEGDEEDEDPGEDHEFEIIDQVESEEDEGSHNKGDEGGGVGSDGEFYKHADNERTGRDSGAGDEDDYTDPSSEEDNIEDSELHNMLEEGIDQTSIHKRPEPREGKPVIRHKTVMKELEQDPFDILPEDWVTVTHSSGMPIYLHRSTRVTTLARPYSLGEASARTHSIPVSAIPCLQYRRQLDRLLQEQTNQSTITGEMTEALVPNGNSTRFPMETASSCPVSSVSSSSSSSLIPVSNESNIGLVTEESSEVAKANQSFTEKEQWDALPSVSSCNPAQEARPAGIEEGTTDGIRYAESGKESLSVSTDAGMPSSTISMESCDIKSSCESNEGQVEETNENLCALQHRNNSTVHSHCPYAEKISDINLSLFTESGNDMPNTNMESDIVMQSGISMKDNQSGTVNSELTEIKSEVDIASELLANSEGSEITEVKDDVDSVEADLPSKSAGDHSNAGNDDLNGGSGSCIVQEEGADNSQEPSELVTSSCNSLANIKRKIDSLRNKRGLASKYQKLDNGVPRPVADHNNVAVSSTHPFEDKNMPATFHASMNEALKANAACIKIKSAEERAKESLLDSKTVHNYCARLFQFKVVEVKKFISWKDRRKHLFEKHKRNNRPELPAATKLISCVRLGGKSDAEGMKRKEFHFNPTGKSYLSILHEYMQRSLKLQPHYTFKELVNSKTPYAATVNINNIEYGTGYASSKKVAKQEAAKQALKILIPDVFNKMNDMEINTAVTDLSFFDNVRVEDPRVNGLVDKVGQPKPFQILQSCLRRNFGLGNTRIDVSTKALKSQKCEFTITVGKHTATAKANNKRDGKQLAAQAILAKLHPHIPSWGSLLRLYGTNEEKPVKKLEDMSNVKSNGPNTSVLDSLREEMRKLHKEKEAIQVKGKMFISSKDLPNKTIGVDL